jgi:hypothetical protein
MSEMWTPEQMAKMKDWLTNAPGIPWELTLVGQMTVKFDSLEDTILEQGKRIETLEEQVKSLSSMVQGNLAEALRNMSQSAEPKKTDG